MAGIKLKHGQVLASVILMAGTFVLAGSSSVFAGFEWRGSEAQAPMAAQSPIRWGNEMPVQKVPSVESAPVDLLPSAPHQQTTFGGEVVSGFGSALPLTIALQQIIPADHQFVLEKDVSTDTSASWTGGKPWPQILTTMLSPLSLGYRLQNRTVTIGHFDGKGGGMSPVALTKNARLPPINMIEAVRKEAHPPAAAADCCRASTPALNSAAWTALKGQTLRSVLTDWAKMEGIELYWSIDYAYRLKNNASYGGTFEEAVRNLLDQFHSIRPQPYGQLYTGEGRPRFLVISSYDLPS